MKNNGLFFSEGAYQWAETLLKNAPQAIVDVDFDKMCDQLKNGDFYDQGITLYESFEGKNPLMMLENVDIKNAKSKILVYPISKESYNRFKTAHPELVEIFLMNGRSIFKKELALGKAKIPLFKVTA